MNFDLLLGKKLLALVLSCCSITLFKTSSVQAATLFWDIELFNEFGTQIGDGEFSYDIETKDILLGENTGITFEISVNTKLESISITLLGETIIDRTAQKWWGINSNVAMQQLQFSSTRFGDIQSPYWSASSSLESPQLLTLNGSSTTSTAEGFWEFAGYPPLGSDSPLQGVQLSGTWNASLREENSPLEPNLIQSTPESSPKLILLSLGILGLFTIRKKSRNIDRA